jgi:MoxR-like ATPase
MTSFLDIQTDLDRQVLGQPALTRTMLLALLAREHVALIGPPGGAKSLAAKALTAYLPSNGHPSYFAVQINRYTDPSEVFGPVSLKALEQDRRERCLAGYAADADVVLLDEGFKANSALSNSLLGLLNERMAEGKPARLETCVVTSNELPLGIGRRSDGGDDLSAFWDRFLFRLPVEPIADERLLRRLFRRDFQYGPSVSPLTLAELEDARAAVEDASLNPSREVEDAVLALNAHLIARHQLRLSERRFTKLATAMAANAVLEGRDSISLSDLRALTTVCWFTLDQHADIREYLLEVAAPWVNALDAIRSDLAKVIATRKQATMDARTGPAKVTAIMDAGESIKRLASTVHDLVVKHGQCSELATAADDLSHARQTNQRLLQESVATPEVTL